MALGDTRAPRDAQCPRNSCRSKSYQTIPESSDQSLLCMDVGEKKIVFSVMTMVNSCHRDLTSSSRTAGQTNQNFRDNT